MKKITMLIGSLLIGSLIYAQQVPTGTANGTANWRRGGNTVGGGAPNIFGTFWNSPIYTYSNSQPRMIVNGTKSPTINNHTFDRSGFVGIGTNGNNFLTNPNIGPYSLLHLNGSGAFPNILDVLGHHDWMKTGITFTSNHDLAYLGMRSVNNTSNLTEFVALWSNNATQFGPDDFAFRFSSNNGATAISNDYNSITDGDGLHVMRLTGTGRMGLGPTFGVGNAIYATPQSLQHLSFNNRANVFTQYTNRNGAGGGGTGETTNDGFRIGILGGNNNQQNGNALLYQQERRHLLLSTNISLTNVDPLNTRERMRITSINAPTELANGGYGGFNPAGLPGNRTRVSISHEPNNPVTRPMSLLHLGYNTGNNFFNAGSQDGWRPWMDIGTFTGNGTDNMYVGLKQETGAFPANDRHDAVVSWGDNNGTNPLNGPDNLRFIFTQTTTGVGNTPPANTVNGLEVARMDPQIASTIAVPNPLNFGMMGIGNFAPSGTNLGPLAVDAKLDIDGDLRIRQVTEDTNLVQVLVIDSNDLNRVHWRNIDLGTTPIIVTNNGVSQNANGVIQLGVPCTDSLGNPDITAIFANAFTTDRVVANRDFNFWFGSLNTETGGVGIGGQPASTPFCNTGNTLEVSANLKSTKYGNANASGLRLTRLTAASPTLANGTNGLDNTKVLTVDEDGDVVLVTVTGGLGLACWDLNGNGIQDPNEDINGDTFFDALDCQGAIGPQGPSGLNGPIGLTGPAGPQGPTGNTGPAGAVGPQGIPGIAGPQGPIGLTGATGATGLQGPIGLTGPTGATGATGPAGPPGSANITADNGLSINPANNVQMGQTYGVAPANTGIGEFIHPTEVPLNNFNLHFTNMINAGTSGFNRVSFGKPVSFSGLAVPIESKVYSFNGDENSAIMGHTDGALLNSSLTLTTAGVTGVLENNNSERAAGVYGISTSSPFFDAIGVFGVAESSPSNIGVRGSAIDNVAINNRGGLFVAAGANVFNTGVLTFGNGSLSGTTNTGVSTSASGPAGSTNYAINASVSGSTGLINFAGFFTGDVNVTAGTLFTPTGTVSTSDNMFKTNQQALTNATSIINQLAPKTYNLDSVNYIQFGFDTKQHMGLIAQEVEQILPDLITNTVMPAQYDSSGVQTSAALNYKGLNYQEFIPLLIAGMQEQQGDLNAKDSLIDNLEDRLAALEECLANTGICNDNGHGNNGGGNGNRIESPSIELSNLNAIILDQNLPNPFAEKTTINYTIPEDVMEAQLMFSDVNGRIIKQVTISERGEGKLTVYGENLEKGIYTYSLIADGELIATKKMMKQ